MSKAAAIAATGVGGGGAAFGGYLIFTNGGGSGKTEEKEQTEQKATEEAQVTTNPLLESFKSSTVSETDCVKDFSGLADLKGGNAKAISNEDKINKDFFNNESGESKGCLKMSWDKKSYTTPDKGWNGTLKLTWTFEKGNKGFITFLAAKEKSKGKLELVGLFYALSKDTNTWSISHKKEVVDAKEIGSDTAENHFPRVGEKLTDLKDKTWWDLFSEKSDIANVCVASDSECKEPSTPSQSPSNKQWTWKGASGDNTHKLDGWTKELSKWWKNLYGEGEIEVPEMAAEASGTWSTPAATTGQ